MIKETHIVDGHGNPLLLIELYDKLVEAGFYPETRNDAHPRHNSNKHYLAVHRRHLIFLSYSGMGDEKLHILHQFNYSDILSEIIASKTTTND